MGGGGEGWELYHPCMVLKQPLTQNPMEIKMSEGEEWEGEVGGRGEKRGGEGREGEGRGTTYPSMVYEAAIDTEPHGDSYQNVADNITILVNTIIYFCIIINGFSQSFPYD